MAGGMQRLMAQSFKRLPKGLVSKLIGEPVVIEGRTLDPVMQVFWNQGQKQAGGDASVDGARAGIKVGSELLSARPLPMKSTQDKTIEQNDLSVPLRIHTPKNLPDQAPVLLWFHQGGFVIGGIDCTDAMCTRFADAIGCIVISVGYRLAPEHKFPAPLRDAEAAFDWLAQNAGSLGADPGKIIVGGESAGGFIAAHLAHYANRQTSGHGQNPMAQVLVYPWLQSRVTTKSYDTLADAYPLGRPMMEWFGSLCFEDEAARDAPEASPGNAPDLESLPPAFIYPAGFDPLTDEAEDYADRLKAAGVDVTFKRFDTLTHSFLMMTGALPAAMAASDRISEDLRTFLKNI